MVVFSSKEISSPRLIQLPPYRHVSQKESGIVYRRRGHFPSVMVGYLTYYIYTEMRCKLYLLKNFPVATVLPFIKN